MDRIKGEVIGMGKDVEFHVCHKCGLVRWTEPYVDVRELNVPFLAWCQCWGRTVFEFEEKSRTMDEAIEIARKRFWDFVELFIDRDREPWEFERLCDEYNVDEETRKKVMERVR